MRVSAVAVSIVAAFALAAAVEAGDTAPAKSANANVSLALQLFRAAKAGDTATVEQIVRQIPDGVKVKDTNGQTPLHLAADGGNATTVRSLLDHRAEVDAKDINGATPLLHAVRSGKVDAARALCERGADVEAADNAGLTPAKAASGHAEFADALRAKPAKGTKAP